MPLKISSADFERLETVLEPTLERFPVETTRAEYIAKGRTLTRLVWDYFHATSDRLQLSGDVDNYLWIRSLYDRLNDSHIESALRSIILR